MLSHAQLPVFLLTLTIHSLLPLFSPIPNSLHKYPTNLQTFSSSYQQHPLSLYFIHCEMSDSHHSSDDPSEVTTKEQGPESQDHEFSQDEQALITRMYNLLGDRWSLIAGRIPGRTADEIERYWKSKCSTED